MMSRDPASQKTWDREGRLKPSYFPIVTCGCENWTIKKPELQRIDAFELCCWRRLLRVSWTARRANQSILKEISPEYSLEGTDAVIVEQDSTKGELTSGVVGSVD